MVLCLYQSRLTRGRTLSTGPFKPFIHCRSCECEHSVSQMNKPILLKIGKWSVGQAHELANFGWSGDQRSRSEAEVRFGGIILNLLGSSRFVVWYDVVMQPAYRWSGQIFSLLMLNFLRMLLLKYINLFWQSYSYTKGSIFSGHNACVRIIVVVVFVALGTNQHSTVCVASWKER